MNAPTALRKFEVLEWTAKGEARASIPLKALETLWFNTGTLCNITCANCYIESSPRNDRLAYLTLQDVRGYLDEIARDRLATRLIGFTGGEPFMNAAFPAILEEALSRGFETLTLTNAMRPMTRRKAVIARLVETYGGALRFRVSVDDYRAEVHDRERGKDGFAKTLDGLQWLHDQGAVVEVAARRLTDHSEADMRAGFARLFGERGIAIVCANPRQLMIFPEMRADADPPEITPACWGILNVSPDGVMCSTARMVVKRKGAGRPTVLACTLLPYDARFDLGATLAEASRPVHLAHKYCATFCVLGGASCGTSRDD
jgi:MoaA/NifB/PqqE/SkfB family radical SAM enzyme